MEQPRISRRALLGAAGAALGAAAVPAFRIPATAATTPPGFPSGISLYQQAYENWSEQILIENAWTCAPSSPADVVAIANWAYQNGYTIRAKGMGHGWSPLLLPEGAGTANVVLLDTTQHLTAVSANASGSPATVTAQTGVTMDNLTAALQSAGLGFAAIPAPGDLTLGGVLAINGHGSAIPANGETREAGTSYGSLSNLIQSLTAVVWNGSAHALQTFQRDDPAIANFLVHLGRAFVTEVTLQAGTLQYLRCRSSFDVQVTDVFAAPAAAGSNSFASMVEDTGRIEVIWFPFTTVPWIKQWTLAPSKPLLSTKVTSPYNYTFANFATETVSNDISDIVAGDVSITPSFENTLMAVVGSGLITTGTWDIWGASRDVLLYVQPTTLRIVEAGYAVVTARSSIQQVVHDFYTQYVSLLNSYSATGAYPMNGPIEIRVTGLDDPAESGVSGAVGPRLSSVRPRPDQPGWDVCVWLDMGTIPVTPDAVAFYATMEQWILSHYTGTYATVRPEWSKAWAVTSSGAWTSTTALTGAIPAAVSAGQASGDGFAAAAAALDSYDPHRIYSNTFLDTLLP